MLKIAILDDYAGVALQCADWSRLPAGAEITVFDRHLGEEEAATVLAPFDVLCTMRERMAMPRSLFARLPRLKLVTIAGMKLANLDMAAATEHGIVIVHSDSTRPAFARIANAAPELAWGLILATVRHIAREDARMRVGGWQSSMGALLAGRTLGLLGLGRIGQRMARYGHAFDMPVIAWSQNLTAESATAVGVRRVQQDELFGQADVLSIHLQLSERTRGLVGARGVGSDADPAPILSIPPAGRSWMRRRWWRCCARGVLLVPDSMSLTRSRCLWITRCACSGTSR